MIPLGQKIRSLLKATFSGRLLQYEKLCRPALLPCNKFIVKLHLNATWAGFGDVRGRILMPIFMWHTSCIYSLKLARPLFKSERFAVHQVPCETSTTDDLGVDPFGIQQQWQYLKMDEKALMFGKSMTLCQIHGVMLHSLACTKAV